MECPERRAFFSFRSRVWVFVLLTAIGVVRGVSDLVFYPRRMTSLAWLAPRPQVFVDEHYRYLKEVTVTLADGTQHRYTLNSEQQWPLRVSLLITAYSLIHCLDRPQQIELETWKKVVRNSFCRAEIASNILKSELLEQSVKTVSVRVDGRGAIPVIHRNVSCSE